MDGNGARQESGRRPVVAGVDGSTGSRAAEVLAMAARGAQALVVGHRGRGAVAGALLGSVGRACVLHAPCPVTVVPAPAPVAA